MAFSFTNKRGVTYFLHSKVTTTKTGKTQTLSLAVYDAVQAGNDAEATVLVIIISTVCLTILVVSGKAFKAGYL